MKKIIIYATVLISLTSCTDNQSVRMFGGSQTIKMKHNEVLLNITWKDNDMWCLSEDTTTGVKYFRESSSFGVWEGEVTILNGDSTDSSDGKPTTTITRGLPSGYVLSK